jgi:hypothetical protein
MARHYQTTPISKTKLTAVVLGAGLIGVEIWTNVEFVAKSEGLVSSPVAMVVAASAGAAAALPFAEHAAKRGRRLLTFGFTLFFLLMAVYSIGASVDRIGSLRDGKTDSAKVDNCKGASGTRALRGPETDCGERVYRTWVKMPGS